MDTQLILVRPLVTGNSVYAPFMDAGVPVGGLFIGAGSLKTEEQSAIYGAVAGEPNDVNYHTAGDTTANANLVVEEQMLKAIAAPVEYFAENAYSPATQSISTKTAKTHVFDYKGSLLQR